MKKTFVLLWATMLLCVTGAWAQSGDFGENNALHWELVGGTLTISGVGEIPGYDSEDFIRPWGDNVDIQYLVIEEGVTSIGYKTFAGSSIISLTFPSSISKIIYSAFSFCQNLSNIDFGSNITEIGKNAFYDCKNLISVNLPDNATFYGGNAFINCENLQEINVSPSHIAYTSMNGVLYNKEMTAIIAYPTGRTEPFAIPAGIIKLEEGAFSGSVISKVTISNSMEELGREAFHGCANLTAISIPENVKIIGIDCFYGTPLEHITISQNLTSIHGGAFALCSIKSFLNRRPIPQEITGWTFHSRDLSNSTLLVPQGSKTLYEAAPGWEDFGNIIETPQWTVDYSNYPNTMTHTAKVILDGTELQNDHLEIGAFSGSECRGSVMVKLYPELETHSYLGFLTVHGNSGEEITFKVFNYETGKEYESTNEPIPFSINAIYGNLDEPYSIIITDTITQRIPLNEGWMWISTNIMNTGQSLLNQFKQNIGNAGVLLKDHNQYIQAPYWIGTLQEINNREMYMINTNAATTLPFSGLLVNPAATPISLLNGWNWIGYTPQTSFAINEALANITPQDGDQIKSHSSYSTYTSGNWVGSLTTLNPGEGYMYYSHSAQTLRYPEAVSNPNLAPALHSNQTPVDRKWPVDGHRFSTNMTVTSVVELNGVELQDGQIEIGAFAGDECRGSALLQNVQQTNHSYLGFLVVYGDITENIKLRIYDHASGQEYEAINLLSFVVDAIHGNPVEPYKIVMKTTGINAPVQNELQISPNPASNYFTLSQTGGNAVVVYNNLGVKIFEKENISKEETVSVANWASGIYYVMIYNENRIMSNQKLIKK